VIEKAMEAFWLHGYQGIGIQALLKHMGISRQSLYNTFGDKRQLFLRVLEHYAKNYLGPQVALLERPGSSTDNIVACVDAVCELARKDQPRGCLVSNTLVELAPHDPEIKALIQSLMSGLDQALQQCIRRGIEQKELSNELHVQEASDAISSILVGLAVASKISPPESFYAHSLRSIRHILDA